MGNDSRVVTRFQAIISSGWLKNYEKPTETSNVPPDFRHVVDSENECATNGPCLEEALHISVGVLENTLYICVYICMPATCNVLLSCIHNEIPFEQNLWWLHCGFVKENILNSTMEKPNVTHFRYLFATFPTKPSLFFLYSTVQFVSFLSICLCCPFAVSCTTGKEAFQLDSVSKIMLKLNVYINT